MAASTTATTPSAVTPARSSAARRGGDVEATEAGQVGRRRDPPEHHIGVGDGGRGATPAVARGAGNRPALSGPTTSAPPGSSRATDPPPAPMVRIASDGRRTGSPATRRVPVGAGTPPCTRHTSVLVPPMSNATASPKPHARATAAAARTPPAGPERSRRAGCAAASDNGTRPPADVITSTSSASGARLSRYGAHTERNAASAAVVDHALVLAELGRHLVGAHDVVATGAQHRGDGAFVGRVEVGVQQAHRDRIERQDRRCRRRRRRRRRTVRARDRARRVVRTPRTAAHAARAVRDDRRARRRGRAAPAARSRSRRRSRGWSPTRRDRGAVRAARSSPPWCRGPTPPPCRHGARARCIRRRPRGTGCRGSTGACAPRRRR